MTTLLGDGWFCRLLLEQRGLDRMGNKNSTFFLSPPNTNDLAEATGNRWHFRWILVTLIGPFC